MKILLTAKQKNYKYRVYYMNKGGDLPIKMYLKYGTTLKVSGIVNEKMAIRFDTYLQANNFINDTAYHGYSEGTEFFIETFTDED